MATRVHHPAKKEAGDQTGLALLGRHTDGRYQYRSLSVLYQRNVVALTHEARVGLALCKRIAWAAYRSSVYPMTRQSTHAGFGTIGGSTVWIYRPGLERIGRLFLDGKPPPKCRESSDMDLLAHELGHNASSKRGHGPVFRAAHVRMRVEVDRFLSNGWPPLDMRKLRDSVAPHLRAKEAKKKRRAVAASMTRVDKWLRALDRAEANLAVWQGKLKRAERSVTKYERDARRARLFLAKAKENE